MNITKSALRGLAFLAGCAGSVQAAERLYVPAPSFPAAIRLAQADAPAPDSLNPLGGNAATPDAGTPVPTAPSTVGTPPAPPAPPPQPQPAALPPSGTFGNAPSALPNTGGSASFGNPGGSVGDAQSNTGTLGGVINGTAPQGPPPPVLGGPINGTASAYGMTPPNATPNGNGFGTTGQSNGRRGSGSTQDDRSSPNLQPLGAVPNTRDQVGTLGNRGGYNAQGVYTGTATTQNGYGYGSAYAPNGRPTGGLLSTNVDATGPLRPYIPLDTGTIARPNSGYGVPNGSRPSHMDGRGVQRVN